MPIVPAKCTFCDAVLKVDDSLEAVVCQHCGTPYIVEKAINNYNNINVTINNNNYNGGNSDFVIRAGELVKYNGSDVDVVIPDNVTYIGEAVFRALEGLRTVTIPDSVVKIGAEAFWACTNLSEIHFSSNLRKIEDRAFYSCESLTEVILPDSAVEFGEGVFECCSNLSSVVLSDDIQMLPSEMFKETKLTSIKLPSHLRKIWCRAFYGCVNLSEISFPDSLEEIGVSAFEGCVALSEISFPASLRKIRNYAFKSCAFKRLDFPHTISEIGRRAFSSCKSLEVVTLCSSTHLDCSSDGYVSGDQPSFEYCIKLADVRIDDKPYELPIIERFSRDIPFNYTLLMYNQMSNRLDKKRCIYCNTRLPLFGEKCKNQNCKSYLSNQSTKEQLQNIKKKLQMHE